MVATVQFRTGRRAQTVSYRAENHNAWCEGRHAFRAYRCLPTPATTGPRARLWPACESQPWSTAPRRRQSSVSCGATGSRLRTRLPCFLTGPDAVNVTTRSVSPDRAARLPKNIVPGHACRLRGPNFLTPAIFGVASHRVRHAIRATSSIVNGMLQPRSGEKDLRAASGFFRLTHRSSPVPTRASATKALNGRASASPVRRVIPSYRRRSVEFPPGWVVYWMVGPVSVTADTRWSAWGVRDLRSVPLDRRPGAARPPPVLPAGRRHPPEPVGLRAWSCRMAVRRSAGRPTSAGFDERPPFGAGHAHTAGRRERLTLCSRSAARGLDLRTAFARTRPGRPFEFWTFREPPMRRPPNAISAYYQRPGPGPA